MRWVAVACVRVGVEVLYCTPNDEVLPDLRDATSRTCFLAVRAKSVVEALMAPRIDAMAARCSTHIANSPR